MFNAFMKNDPRKKDKEDYGLTDRQEYIKQKQKEKRDILAQKHQNRVTQWISQQQNSNAQLLLTMEHGSFKLIHPLHHNFREKSPEKHLDKEFMNRNYMKDKERAKKIEAYHQSIFDCRTPYRDKPPCKDPEAFRKFDKKKVKGPLFKFACKTENERVN